MIEDLTASSANDRFKRGQANWTRVWLLVAVAVHLAAFSLIRFDVQALAAVESHPLEFIIPKEADLPPPRDEIMRPALPRISNVLVTEEPRFGRWDYIPPAPTTRLPTTQRPSGPSFVPYDRPPVLMNGEAIGRVLEREYPRKLRRAGVEGRVELWLFVTEVGVVERGEVKTSSGDAHLDDAALRVATEMRFAPARNRDRATAVWVQQWIAFVVR